MQISALFVLEVINIGIALIFLSLFLYRLKYLSHFSQTDKYLNYYPKIRILFAVVYVVLSFALLGYNISIKEYQSEGEQYLFAGGGGQTINSLVLLLQLFVLRQQLIKQRPYTPSHMIYFFYLVIISIVRFGLTISAVVKQQNQQITDLILATCLMIDACIQLGYWIAKKQTLPEFENNNYFSFDEFRIQSNRHLINRNDVSNRIQQKSCQDDFPYIKPTVNVENSKFRIILEIFASNNVLPSNFDSTNIEKLYLHPSQIQGKNVSQILKSSISFRRSNNLSKGSFHLEIISEHLYNLEQLKQLYILCGRFNLKKQISFSDLSLRDVTKSLQVFLDEVFSERRNYQPFLLKYFHIDKELLQIYEEKNKNMEEIIVSDYRSTRSGKVYTSHYDKNSIYLSIQIYKQLWIEDHYEFYMKVSITQTHEISYPMRRFSEFQDFDMQLKSILAQNAKNTNYVFQLPPLPKKHLFNLDQEKINQRRSQLQSYLRKLCNDYTIVEIPEIREVILNFLNLYSKILHLSPVYEVNFYDQVKIIKGNISKALINNDYVTFYEFKLYRQGIEIRSINKRFSDFVTLNEDIQRWMNNIQICYKSINLPEKHLYKSQTYRHEKLRNYLQTIINVKQSYQIYCLNVFFNIAGNSQLSDDTFYSAISFVRSKEKEPSSVQWNGAKGFGSQGRQHEMQMQRSPQFSYSIDGKRMSALIDQLGRDQLE